METTTEAPKQRGNPNFGKKPANTNNSKYDPKKRYQFQLCDVIETAKPRDYETGELVDSPYPPVYLWMNEGQGINPDSGEIENWRYVFGYASIWVKDQINPVPGKRQLENPKNFIEFKNGSLFVMGSNTALMDAMTIQDAFEGVKDPINIVPPVYRIVDLDKERKALRTRADVAFEAERAAREASFQEMIPVAMHLGITVDNAEQDSDRIRDEFILKAKSHPEVFSQVFGNPKTKVKYNIIKALQAGLISGDQIPGKMSLVSNGKIYFDLKSGDIAEQFAALVMSRMNEAVSLYELIKTQI